MKNTTRRIPDIADLRKDVTNLDQQVRRMAREQPLLVLAMALASGYLIGRVVARL